MSTDMDRETLRRMSKDQLVDVVLELGDEVDQLREDVDAIRENAAQDRAEIRRDMHALEDELREDVRDRVDRVHRERSKTLRRLSAVEDEVGITTQDALAVAEGGEDARHMSRLGRLLRHGPDAVVDRATAKHYRAKTLVENWNRWGQIKSDAHGRERRLASKKHNLKSRLEDVEGSSLGWIQLYRAMELVAEWSEGAVSLEDGSHDEGKYVLVHRLEGGDR